LARNRPCCGPSARQTGGGLMSAFFGDSGL
jgi:hypothetical protein